MATVTTNQLLDMMIDVLNRVPKESRPQYYLGDIIWDIRMVYGEDFQTTDKWVWFIGDCGTHVAKSTGMFEALQSSYGGYVQYYWDGHSFVKLEPGADSPLGS